MNVHLECFPCFLRQVVIALELNPVDRELEEKVMKAVLPEIERADLSQTPAHATTFIHRRVRQTLGADPFSRIKSEYNRLALASHPALRRLIDASAEPLLTACRLAIAGNVIDFGIFTSVDVEGTIQRALGGPLEVDDFDLFRRAVEGTRDILYLADNAGEIVFDRLLIETLLDMGKNVTAAVKGSPVINDATAEDARQVGLAGLCEVIDNGSDCVGTILPMTSPAFREAFESAPLVISKGQGNFETLMHERKRMFFLFQSKCEVVSRHLGMPLKSMLLMKSDLGEELP